MMMHHDMGNDDGGDGEKQARQGVDLRTLCRALSSLAVGHRAEL